MNHLCYDEQERSALCSISSVSSFLFFFLGRIDVSCRLKKHFSCGLIERTLVRLSARAHKRKVAISKARPSHAWCCQETRRENKQDAWMPKIPFVDVWQRNINRAEIPAAEPGCLKPLSRRPPLTSSHSDGLQQQEEAGRRISTIYM